MSFIGRKTLWKKEKLPVTSIFSISHNVFSSLLNNKILKATKMKTLSDDKSKVVKMFDREGNIVGKGENTGNQHHLLFPQCFSKLSSLQVGIVWQELKDHIVW